MDLIYCAGGNPRLSEIAYEEGWLLGVRSDSSTIDREQSFVDIDYKKPNFERHLEVVAKLRPKYATVPDLSEDEVSEQDIERALRQVEQIAPYCQYPLVVPKLAGQLALLPPDIAIGYSVPSSYGGARFTIWEVVEYLANRRIHILGGSPKNQMQAYLQMSTVANVGSIDGNYAQLMATRYGEYWQRHKWLEHPGVAEKKKDIYFEAWRWSCRNLYAYWQQLAPSTSSRETQASA